MGTTALFVCANVMPEGWMEKRIAGAAVLAPAARVDGMASPIKHLLHFKEQLMVILVCYSDFV